MTPVHFNSQFVCIIKWCSEYSFAQSDNEWGYIPNYFFNKNKEVSGNVLRLQKWAYKNILFEKLVRIMNDKKQRIKSMCLLLS